MCTLSQRQHAHAWCVAKLSKTTQCVTFFMTMDMHSRLVPRYQHTMLGDARLFCRVHLECLIINETFHMLELGIASLGHQEAPGNNRH